MTLKQSGATFLFVLVAVFIASIVAPLPNTRTRTALYEGAEVRVKGTNVHGVLFMASPQFGYVFRYEDKFGRLQQSQTLNGYEIEPVHPETTREVEP